MAYQLPLHVDLNFQGNEAQNLVIQNSGGLPSSPSNGQIIFHNGVPKYYLASSGSWFSMSAVSTTGYWANLQGGTSINQSFIVSTGGLISFTGAGIINTNQFNGNTVVAVVDGGTAHSSFPLGELLIGSGTSIAHATGLKFQSSGPLQLIINNAVGSGTLAITPESNTAPIYISPQSLLTVPLVNTIEYNGSGLYFSDQNAVRWKVADFSDSINSFTGPTSIIKGGTNATSFSANAVLFMDNNNVRMTGIVPTATSGQFLAFDGLMWKLATGITNDSIIKAPTNYVRNAIKAGSGIKGLVIYSTGSSPISTGGYQQNSYFEIQSRSDNAILQIYEEGMIPQILICSPSIRFLGTGISPDEATLSMYSSLGIAGSINTNGDTADGGNLITHNGGGTLNTYTGYLQLGIDGTRTTLTRSSTTNRSITIPDRDGTFLVASGINAATSGQYMGYNGSYWIPSTVVASGGSVSDGDKGDITVSGAGSVWTIDNDSVTYAKIQNISAASKILGRGSESGSGDTEEISVGGGLSVSGTTLISTGIFLNSVSTTSPISISGINSPVISTNITSNRLIGRTTAGSGVMEEIRASTGLVLNNLNLSVDYGTSSSTACIGNDNRLTKYVDSFDGILKPSFPLSSTNMQVTGGAGYFNFLGRASTPFPIRRLYVRGTTAGVGAQTAEMGVFKSPLPPNASGQVVTCIWATGSIDSFLSVSATTKHGTTVDNSVACSSGDYLWYGIRINMATTQPFVRACTADWRLGGLLVATGSSVFAAGSGYIANLLPNCEDSAPYIVGLV